MHFAAHGLAHGFDLVDEIVLAFPARGLNLIDRSIGRK